MSPPPLSLQVYRLATAALSPLAPLLLRARARRGKEDPERMGERLGRAGLPRPDGALVWLHGASVGEALSLLPLIETLAKARPDLVLLATSGTATSAALMARRLPTGAIHQYAPLDTPAAGAAFLDHWRPSLGVIVESELWPNLLLGAKRRGTKLALVSAKLSEKSWRGWRRAPGAARRLFGGFDLILAQDERAAARLADLGAKPSGIADLKFGAAPLPVDEAALAARRAEFAGRAVILAASTHTGEEPLILRRWQAITGDDPRRPLLVIVPRHPERGPAVADLARAMGLAAALQSAGDAPDRATSVLVADALGELGLWFRLARLAVMGGSFIAGVGGHNPLEPARLGAPIISGPHVENWATAYGDLDAAGAGRLIAGPEALDLPLLQALDEAPALAVMAGRARAFTEARDVAARAVLAPILALAPLPQAHAR